MSLTTTTLTRTTIIAGDNYGPVTKTATISSGANLVAGTILARVTATGELAAYDADAHAGTVGDPYTGLEIPVAVLMEDAAAASADVTAVVGFAGVYKTSSMTGLDAAGTLLLEARGIYFV